VFLGDKEGPQRLLLKKYDKSIPGRYLVYAFHIHFPAKTMIVAGRWDVLSLDIDLYMPVLSHECSFITFFGSNNTIKPTKSMIYTFTIHMHGIYQAYAADLLKTI
jgi:hypothetical protein